MATLALSRAWFAVPLPTLLEEDIEHEYTVVMACCTVLMFCLFLLFPLFSLELYSCVTARARAFFQGRMHKHLQTHVYISHVCNHHSYVWYSWILTLVIRAAHKQTNITSKPHHLVRLRLVHRITPHSDLYVFTHRAARYVGGRHGRGCLRRG